MNVTEKLAPSALIARFREALAGVGGHTHLVSDTTTAHECVTEIAQGRPAVIDDDPLLRATTTGLHHAPDPWQAEIGITTAFAACAETGTLALAFDSRHARSTSLVPPCHIAVLPAARLVSRYAELLEHMADISPIPSGMQLITGPSASADIEMIHIQGMHGPTAVHVVLMVEASQDLPE
ncbi:YkgG family uncharacterized protein [Halopolyspora algeriensis]|uniref:YkgG family uncharacterized protein n=1 Tax=Halopolyspora algeriensis TaxID=1500506 RepID=A0A368VVC8_9ACTN|nr:LUD domain-containing protein [Halopolyspora algeriensis]RCW45803.1 YkgG family uncharacterized protein [Halopolyspora algeriensis]TQM54187.1 YkgG family uncharacterized protein [Halopolyspora algeriensis]